VGVLLPLAIAVGSITSLILGLIAFAFAVRGVYNETIAMGRYLVNSLGATLLFMLLTALVMVYQVKEFEDMLTGMFFLGAAPGIGLWVGYFWARRAARTELEPPAAPKDF
jgi:hypothetical protein